ncbi:hypothetical protein GCM10022214_59730 [Actinomadura miaoliensis]|uniref:Glycosyltransferase RgtA/B/C/D-like domain-containing protein n=1 Tax=Actinomadura miaoliensis TaxID=430685 RepID=A0ABP7WMF2_9ACTN
MVVVDHRLKIGERLGRPGARATAAHAPFAVVLTAGIALRVLAVLGYPSVLWFGDSEGYLRGALRPEPSELRPSGYSLMLWLLKPFGDFTLVVAVQHLMGVAVGVMLYAVAWRAARAAWPDRALAPGLVGAAVAAPSLLDAYQIELEHLLMSDTAFTFLVTAALTVLLWRPGLTWRTGAAAGLMLGAAALTRSVGLPLIAVVVVCLALRRVSWRAVAASVAAFAMCVGAYAGWYRAVHGEFALSSSNGAFLYGRTAAFADCREIRPPADLRVLCREQTRHVPGVAPAFAALWTKYSPFRDLPGGVTGRYANELATRFALRAVRAQPADYAWTVARDTSRSFAWTRSDYPRRWTASQYRFPEHGWMPKKAVPEARAYGRDSADPRVVEPYAGWMRAYQKWGYLPGTLLGVILAAGLAGMAVRRRPWGGAALLPRTRVAEPHRARTAEPPRTHATDADDPGKGDAAVRGDR